MPLLNRKQWPKNQAYCSNKSILSDAHAGNGAGVRFEHEEAE